MLTRLGEFAPLDVKLAQVFERALVIGLELKRLAIEGVGLVGLAALAQTEAQEIVDVGVLNPSSIMALRSRIAAGQSLALILARTAARSGAAGLEGVSTADNGGARPVKSKAASSVPKPSLRARCERRIGGMGAILSLVFNPRRGAGRAWVPRRVWPA